MGKKETCKNNDMHTDHVNRIGVFGSRSSNEEVVRLYVPVYQRFVVDSLNTRNLNNLKRNTRNIERYSYHLLSSHADSFDTELSPAHVKKVFQIRTKKVYNENVVQALLTKVMHLRNTG